MLEGRLYSPGPDDVWKRDRLWIEPQNRQEFTIGKGKSVLLTLRSHVARNIYNLLHRKIVDDAFHNKDMNCHAAAAIALGERRKITWSLAHYRGEPMLIEEAIAELPLPCGMQIHNSSKFREILHSAVLLGPTIGGPAIAFHKDGTKPMEICSINAVIAAYDAWSRHRPLTFYPADPRSV